MPGIWTFFIAIGIWAFVEDLVVRQRNKIHGRPEDDPRGELGCLSYIIFIFTFLVAIFLVW